MDQEAVVQFDPNGKGTDNVTRDAQQLSRTQGGHIILSLPLRRKAEVIGVVTIEFLPTTRIGPQVANGLAIAVDLLAPQLWDRYQNDRWLVTKAAISTRNVAAGVVGPRHMIAKLIAVLVIGIVAFAVLYKPMYRVSAPFQFVPTAKYTLAAPYEGYTAELATVNDPIVGQRKLKPGDLVHKGQLLMRLRTTDLEKKRGEALAAVAQHEKEEISALAENKPESPAKAQIARDQADQARAQLKLLEEQIAEASIVSPIEGRILEGDWEDKQGAPVRQGDVLFLVGQPEDLRVELQVAERDIQDVQLLKHAAIATNSLPDDKYDVVIERIEPMGEAKEGNNVFKVYATVKNSSPSWRPGMAGEAKVDVETRPVWWIYSHRLIDFVKLKAWTWGV